MYKRICPECKLELNYTHPVSFKYAVKHNKMCGSCKASLNAKKPERKQHLIEISKKGILTQPMKDKSFYDVWLEKYGKENADIKMLEWKSKLTNSDQHNFKLSGLTVQQYWLVKYGKEEANEKTLKWKQKLSIQNTGEKNKMFGKPSPQGSGNGWSGWYKNWFFRSLRELSYMINIIERFNLTWESGEQNKYKISYQNWEGKTKNYFPDFVINKKYIVECKPKKLHNSFSVKVKSESAIEWCKLHNFKYKITDPKTLSESEIIQLYKSKKIIFTPRYEEKFKLYYKLNT